MTVHVQYPSGYWRYIYSKLTNPLLLSINPSSANQGETLDVTITGDNTNFAQDSGTTLSFTFEQGSSTIVNSYEIVDDEILIANVTIPNEVDLGTYGVSISNEVDGTLYLPNSFEVTSSQPIPSLVSITPNQALQGETLDVTILAENTHFTNIDDSTILLTSFDQFGFSVVNSISIIDDTTILANITIPPVVPPGTYDIIVSNNTDGELTLENGFTVIELFIPEPSLLSISPNEAGQSQTLDIIVYGENTHFANEEDSTTLEFSFNQGGSTIVNYYTIIDDTTLGANITIPSDIDTGIYNITVSNNTDGELNLDSCFRIVLATQIDIISANYIILYPNPVKDIITIKSNEIIENIEVRDVLGKVVYSSVANHTSITLDATQLSNNIYFVRCLVKDKLIIKRFTVKH